MNAVRALLLALAVAGCARQEAPAAPVEPPRDPLALAWPAADWDAIAQVVAANWVRDLADDLDHAASQRDPAGTPARQALDGARAWWTARHGPAGDLLDRAWLEAQPRAALEALGRRLRAGWLELAARNAIAQWPRPPGHPRPSGTPFGDAITVKKDPPPDVAVAYQIQLEYTQAALAIEEAVDAGAAAAPFALVVEYRRAQDVVRPRDYAVLARHQIAGMRRFFGSDASHGVPLRRFADALWAMTVAGHWEHSKHSLARWLKWIDAWQAVRAGGRVPELVDAALLGAGSATPPSGGK